MGKVTAKRFKIFSPAAETSSRYRSRMRYRSLNRWRRTRLRSVTSLLALGLALVACGGNGTKTKREDALNQASPTADASGAVSPTVGASAPSRTPAVKPDLPDVEVIDVRSGAKVNVTSLAPSEHSFLLWFWAPH